MNGVTVLNPRGQRPPTQYFPMAPRLDTLERKTVYVVDIRWPYTVQFSEELFGILAERFPRTTFRHRLKAGSYGEADPKLWEEIKEKGDAMILATGH
jgi:hypothetical protein